MSFTFHLTIYIYVHPDKYFSAEMLCSSVASDSCSFNIDPYGKTRASQRKMLTKKIKKKTGALGAWLYSKDRSKGKKRIY